MAFQQMSQSGFLQLGISLDAVLFAQSLEAGRGLLQETPLAQQGFRFLGSCRLGVLEVVEGSARALQMIRHPAVHPGIGARQFPVALLKQISDRWARAHGFPPSWLAAVPASDASAASATALAFTWRQRVAC